METWLIDKSALVRLSSSPDAERWVSLIQRGLVYMTGVTLLEVGYSARTAEKRGRARASAPLVSMPTDFLTPAMEHRAMDVQAQLAQRGLHRGPSIADLLIAAAAEVGGRTLLHVDKDFDLIVQVTGQSLERLVLPM